MITGKTYEVLKFLALIAFPALGTLYFALAAIWGLPAAEQVVGTIVAVDTFLGVILQISASNYNKQLGTGTMNVVDTADKLTYDLVLDGDPADLVHKQEVRFKVKLPT